MDEEDIRGWIERLLDELAGIRAEVDALDRAAPDTTLPFVFALLAVLLSVGALGAAIVAMRSTGRMHPHAVAPERSDRARLAAELRRFSELLGIEAVTGRAPSGAEDAETMRARLESRAAEISTPGALELLDEVRRSRGGLADLPQEARAASSGLAGMTVEWSIDRWLRDPDGWLRDHRERARLQALGRRAAMAPPSGEPEATDTRRR